MDNKLEGHHRLFVITWITLKIQMGTLPIARSSYPPRITIRFLSLRLSATFIPHTIKGHAVRNSNGFTLIEMAITLFIVALLLGGLLVPLGAQVEHRKVTETQKALDEIKEALLGYVIINGYFPCPTTETDPANAKLWCCERKLST